MKQGTYFKMETQKENFKSNGTEERQVIERKDSKWDKSRQKILKAVVMREIRNKLKNSDGKLKQKKI